MSKEVRLPDLGEGVMEGQILRVLVGEGDNVTEDQPLLEVETDKASVEIPSPHTGVVQQVHVTQQQVVNVGDVMVTFAEEDVGGGAGGNNAFETARENDGVRRRGSDRRHRRRPTGGRQDQAGLARRPPTRPPARRRPRHG